MYKHHTVRERLSLGTPCRSSLHIARERLSVETLSSGALHNSRESLFLEIFSLWVLQGGFSSSRMLVRKSPNKERKEYFDQTLCSDSLLRYQRPALEKHVLRVFWKYRSSQESQKKKKWKYRSLVFFGNTGPLKKVRFASCIYDASTSLSHSHAHAHTHTHTCRHMYLG